MALTPASVLADYSSGIGTQGATLKVNTSDKRVGIGTTNPQGTLQVGTGITMGSGIITATAANFSGNLTATGGDFSGNVSVGGVLTYEDVTNVDSVGVITARQGIRIGAGESIGSDGAEVVYYGNGFNLTGIDATAIKDSAGGTVRVQANTSGAVVSGILTATTLEQTQTYPTIRPTLDLNFAATKTLDRRITFTRDGVGTFTDDMGIVKYASNNVPRFDHNPTTGESLGLLIEESRTNNNKVTNLAVDGMTTANGWDVSYMQTPQHYTTVTSPDGLNNSTLLAPNTQNIPHYAYVNWPGDVLTGIRTVSCWFKNLSTTIYYPQLRIIGAGSGVAYANFTLSGNGTISSGGSDITGATITPYPNGWYRCTLSWNTTTTHYGGGIVISNSMSSELPTYVGDADDTKGFLAWGFQDEAGSFATSLIPTNGTAVTRGADNAGIKGTNFTDFYNATEGTFFIDSGIAQGSSYLGYLGTGTSSASDGGPSNNFNSIMSDNDNSDVILNIWDNSAEQATIPFAYPASGNIKVAGVYKTNDFAISMNGSAVSSDSSGSIDTNQDQFWIGRRPYSENGYLNNSIKKISYYNKRLTNDQLQGLTA